MSEEGQYYDLVPNYDDNKDSQTIPPISTFAKRTGSGGSSGPDEYASPPGNFYNPETDVQSSGDLDNNNSSTDSSEAPPPLTPTNSQPPEPTTILQRQQQQQQQTFNTLTSFQSGDSQVHLPVSGSNTVPPAHVVNNVVPTALHGGVPIQGNLIPFITTNGGQPPGLSHTPEQMVQFSAAMNLAAAAAAASSSMGGGQSVFTSAPGQPGVIQVHDSMQHAAFHPNIDLQHHLPPHALKNGKEMPPTPPASADEKDGDDSERRKTLANLVPHTHQPLPTSMPVPHLMTYNPAQTTLAGQAPNFIPGSGPGSGPAPVAYGNVPQIPLQNPPPPVSMPHPVGPPQAIIGDQSSVMMPPIDCVDHGAGPSGRRQAQNNKRRGNKKAVPVEDKDDRYFERRKRNNQAAKRSRDARKVREEQVGMRANYLEKENAILRAQLATLREEANSLRQLLSQRPPVSQMGAPTCM